MADLNLKLIFSAVTDPFISGVNKAKSSLDEFKTQIFSWRYLITGALSGLGLSELGSLADTMRLVEGRIKLASEGTQDYARNQSELVRISLNTNTALEENANMFARIAPGIKQMGGNSQDALVQVELLAKTLKISGASQEESAAIIRQWSQAMASGVLRGDEFNSVMENNPRLAKAMADGLHVSVGELRAMAEAGELSSGRVANAVISQSKAINDEVAKIPVTMGQAMQNLKTQFAIYISEIDKAGGATQRIAALIQGLADGFGNLKKYALLAVDGVITGFADLKYGIESTRLQLDLFFTINPAKADALKEKISQLDAEFAKQAENREATLNSLLADYSSKSVGTDKGQAPTVFDDHGSAVQNAKEIESINKAKLDSALEAIKTEESAAKNAHDLALKQVESDYKAKELSIRQQETNELALKGKLSALASDLSAEKLKIEKAYLDESFKLELAAIDAKTKAQQAALSHAAVNNPANGSLAGVIAGGESGKDTYNSFNRGTLGNKILPALGKEDLTALTIGEIQSRQALDVTNADRLGAVGKYQVIASTLKEAVNALKLTADTKFDAATQEKIFTEYLLDAKRPSVRQFVTGGTNDVNSVIRNLSQEFAAIANPDTGKSFYDGKGGNTSTISVEQIKAAILAARDQFQKNKASGLDAGTSFKLSLSGENPGSDMQASNEKIKALQSERIAATNEYNAKLQALGIDATNNEIENANQSLQLSRAALEQQKAIQEEKLQAKANADLDELAVREQASQYELQLGKITEEEHLNRLKGFADERLQIERKLLDEKRKLLNDDALALLQNLNRKEALEREAAQRKQQIEQDAAVKSKQEQEAIFNGMAGPFQNALSQMTNGIMTGQQTVSNAVRNAAANILTSYVSTFVQERALWAAQWAWKKAGIALNLAEKQALEKGDLIFTIGSMAFEKGQRLAHWAFESSGETALAVKKKSIKTSESLFDNLLWAGKKIKLSLEWAWEFAGEAALSAKKKALKLASTAWDNLMLVGHKAKLAASWLWEVIGFGAKETTKQGIKVGSEAVQTGAQVAGDAARTASATTAAITDKALSKSTTESKLLNAAVSAAAGAYQAIVGIPYVGPILAPIAAAVAFAGVMAFGGLVGSAKGGEMEVGSDNAPYFLHKRESVLPAGVADNFRKVVNIVQGHQNLDVGSIFNEMAANGTIARQLSLPSFAANLPEQSQSSANNFARDRLSADKENRTRAESTHHKSEINMNGIMITPEKFILSQEDMITKVAHNAVRKFKTGNKK